MNKVAAFTPDFDNRKLFRTVRAVREAEFEHRMWAISQNIGAREGLVEALAVLAQDLRGGCYPSAIDAFLAAADYLRTHRGVLTGLEIDPEDRQ